MTVEKLGKVKNLDNSTNCGIGRGSISGKKTYEKLDFVGQGRP